MLNDPFLGGSRLPDITLVSPIHVEGELLGLGRLARAPRRRRRDGRRPRCPPDSTELHQEGADPAAVAARRRPDRPDRRQLALGRRAARRSARPARRSPPRRAADRRAESDAAAPTGGGPRAPRFWDYAERRTRAAIARCGRALPRPPRHVEALEGDLTIRSGGRRSTGKEVRVDFEGTDPTARRQPQLPAGRHHPRRAASSLRVIADPDAPASQAAPTRRSAVTAPEGSLSQRPHGPPPW